MTYSIAVRGLCDFTAKRGDLDQRFTPVPTASEGMAGHATVAARRGSGYQPEVSLSGEWSGEHATLQVRGRADGYDSAAHRIDECKTFRGDLARIPANHRALHWAQLKTYGWLLCQRDGLQEIELALVYFNADNQEETVLNETFSAQSLQEFFDQSCRQFSAWAKLELQHTAARDIALTQLAFPYAAFHGGQRELAEAVYTCASTGRCLLTQAPTGIGKTVGTLFPLLKAMANRKIDRIFYLTAKSTGRATALDALRLLNRSRGQLPLRTVEIVARDKVCEHPDKACHGESCPLARGFYDKLASAREAALACEVMDQRSLRTVALQHGVCPYYLSQEMVRWSDVIVGDYNYYFDHNGFLHNLTLDNQWRVGVLVDEAHNLIERSRQMYSATLDERELDAAKRRAPPQIGRLLQEVARNWNAFCAEQPDAYCVHDDIPERLLFALKAAVTSLTNHAVELAGDMQEDLQHFYFSALHFCRMAEALSEHSLFDVTRAPNGSGTILCIRNVVPAQFLRPRLALARCAVLFSATLTPRHFYTDMLGLPANTRWLDVASPFSAEQLSIRVVHDVSTRYRHRAASTTPILELVAQQFAREPGNYLVFVSSFDYLERLVAGFATRHPHIPIWQQERSMRESERREFLERFETDGRGVGFAVLGGAFAEGVDLPGNRLIGAFIATLGLPQVNAINDQMMQRMQSLFGAGHEYTYLYPGLQKVTQAAGRIIRTTSDRGTLYLIDDRYAREEVLKLLPGWWRIGAERIFREPHPSVEESGING